MNVHLYLLLCAQHVSTVYKRVRRKYMYAAFSLHALYLLLYVIEKLVGEASKITAKT